MLSAHQMLGSQLVSRLPEVASAMADRETEIGVGECR